MLHKRYESEVMDKADVVLTVSETWADDFLRLGAKNVNVITNGYDSDDFVGFKSVESDKFIVGHYGIMNHLRNPSNFWLALNDLCKENSDFNQKLEIRLSGNIDQGIINEINTYPLLSSKLVLLGFLNHKEVISEYSRTNLLLLLLFNSKSGKGNYPGKIFEYFATKKPIIAFGPKRSDVKNLLDKGFGIYHPYNHDISLIKNNILSIYNKEITFKNIKEGEYSREYLTSKLVGILEEI